MSEQSNALVWAKLPDAQARQAYKHSNCLETISLVDASEQFLFFKDGSLGHRAELNSTKTRIWAAANDAAVDEAIARAEAYLNEFTFRVENFFSPNKKLAREANLKILHEFRQRLSVLRTSYPQRRTTDHQRNSNTTVGRIQIRR
jgi:hypothetical protein